MTTPNKANEFEHLGEPEPALALGRLIDVDTKLGTATLDNFMGRQTPLRFDPSLAQEMLRLEDKHVKVRGKGWINESDRWIVIIVEEIIRPVAKPFDMDEFLNDPNPKIFDPDKVIRAREPFDVDEFLRPIYESRGRRYT